MEKTMRVVCCAFGSGMIGFFANRLDTIIGSMCFTIGVILLALSIVLICKEEKSDK